MTSNVSPSLTVEERLSIVQTTVKNQGKTIDNHEAYQKKDAASVERDVNNFLVKMLQLKYPGYHVLNVLESYPSYKHFYEPNATDSLTEFDGLYVVTNDDSYNLLAERPSNSSFRTKSKSSKIIFVIVEAKHDVTTKRINRKIRQIVKIQEAFETARNIRSGNANTKGMKKDFLQRNYQAEYYNMEEEILFVIGGPYLEPNAEEHIKRIGRKLWKEPETIRLADRSVIEQKYPIRTCLMIPNGNRYSLGDVEEDYRCPYM